VVSGIAMARYGQNALEVIHNLKDKIAELGPGLPEGVTVQTFYDRPDLIHRAIETLTRTLIEESVIVALVCVVFLLHVRSALVAILMLPIGVLLGFITMRLLGMNFNLMSLGSIAMIETLSACLREGDEASADGSQRAGRSVRPTEPQLLNASPSGRPRTIFSTRNSLPCLAPDSSEKTLDPKLPSGFA